MAGQKDILVQEYENKLKRNPKSLVFSRLADSYRKRGDIQQAIDVCSLGLKNHPRSTTGRIILGRCYLEQEKVKEAIQEFTQVVESEHRNQMALKMLADVYARQGLKEKAGDVYAYLSAIDPENRSIANLCANFSGTGRTNIHEILGISISAPSTVSSADGNQEYRQDSMEDVDKTIPMRIASGETGPQDAGPFAQTMQFDSEELKAESEDKEFQVEEVISDIAQSVGDQVTGDDISSRMSMMFEDERTGDGDDARKFSEAVKQEAQPRDREAVEQMPVRAFETPDGQDLSNGPAIEISGVDISSRIEQLFGGPLHEEASSATPEYSRIYDSTPENMDEPGPPAQQQSGLIVEPTEITQEELAVIQESPEGADISGEDVVNRMSQMFKSHSDALEQEANPVPAESASHDEGNIDKSIRFDAVPEPVDQIQVSGNIESEDAMISEISEEISSSIGDASQPAESSGGPTDDAVSSMSTEGASVIEKGAISGEDVAARLETIFSEQDPAESFPDTSAEILSDDRSMGLSESMDSDRALLDVDLGKDARSLVSGVMDNDVQPAAGDIPISGEVLDMYDTVAIPDDGPAAQEALGIEEKKINPAEETLLTGQETFNDAESDEETPEMSGDDIVNRLTEIFPDTLLQEDTLSIIDSIPDDEKVEEAVNDGFYTMSGENAQTAHTEETLLETLGDASVAPQNSSAEHGVPFAQEMAADQQQNTPDTRETFQKAADESDRIYSIPEHVLTPTLADIYFQQGQPDLAVQIYTRLLERDPDNEKIARRLDEIKKSISDAHLAVTPEVGKPDVQSGAKPPRRPRANKGKAVRRPLEGVRIKKGIKSKSKEKK